jgi:hypothetical protein
MCHIEHIWKYFVFWYLVSVNHAQYLTRELMSFIFLLKQLAVQTYSLWQFVGLDVIKIYSIYLNCIYTRRICNEM